VIPFPLGDAVAAVGGELVGGADGSALVSAEPVVDSRQAVPGTLFVAVRGEHRDGHEFAAQAVRAGAVAVLAEHVVDGPAWLVPDTVQALGRLARWVLDRTSARVVGVTGSSGKTGTKDMLATLLPALGTTVAAPASYNNEIGLPLTVLRVTQGTRFLLLEYSARGLGHLGYLCGIAPPDVSVVLNVGSAHVGEFGSVEAIARAKAELVEALGPDGVAVLNADDPRVLAMGAKTRGRVVTFGLSAEADVSAEGIGLDELARPHFRLRCRTGEAEVQLASHGVHHVSNALAAAAVGLECGLSVHRAAELLSAAGSTSRWRMEVNRRSDGVLVVNDAYNANPESTRAGLRALAHLARGGRAWAVLGEMRELGERAVDEHRAVGRFAVEQGVRRLVVVGAPAGPIADGAIDAGADPAEVFLVGGTVEAVAVLAGRLRPGDAVLVKASRAAGLERAAAALLAPATSEVRA
jgi:UDP-N-acetylmuramoyl-tripeptide--D-alanyl-D-alanine ligase